MTSSSKIPTPWKVRWQRLRYQAMPVIVVLVCGAVAFRLWRETPRISVVGQVNPETAEARSPTSGTVAEPSGKPAPQLFEAVSAGQVIARVEKEPGKWEDVKSPLAGQVTEVHKSPGQTIGSGQTIYTIAASRGKRVTAYFRGDQAGIPEPGAAVQVQSRSNPGRSYRAVVERIGPQYQPVPAAQLRDRKTEEWGLPVIIQLLPTDPAGQPDDVGLRPGELVMVNFKELHAPPASSNPAGKPAAPKLSVDAASPRPN